MKYVFTEEAIAEMTDYNPGYISKFRINKPKHCWHRKGVRSRVPCHHIRQYRYAYGAVDPVSGDSCFLIHSAVHTGKESY